ncbi:MAG: M67 family metallopeptidase [Desulfovibrio sp.]|jgi:proteasome lid subunit RPN8/RPN11|nr:M67 family metallopeptidase [Desulfovibrio sp.]
MTLVLKKTDYALMLAHARRCLPEEACGLIAGRRAEDGKRVEKVYLTANGDRSREHFSIDPQEQLGAVKDMRARGLVPLGNFHSHPETPARPSPEDIRLARDPSASYLILSLAGPEPELKSFHLESDLIREEELILV